MADFGGLKTYKRMIVSTLKSYQVFHVGIYEKSILHNGKMLRSLVWRCPGPGYIASNRRSPPTAQIAVIACKGNTISG